MECYHTLCCCYTITPTSVVHWKCRQNNWKLIQSNEQEVWPFKKKTVFFLILLVFLFMGYPSLFKPVPIYFSVPCFTQCPDCHVSVFLQRSLSNCETRQLVRQRVPDRCQQPRKGFNLLHYIRLILHPNNKGCLTKF